MNESRDFAMASSVFIRRVRARNFKSIAACDVELGPLSHLVGPNGSGKSNFLDVLHFVKDALQGSLENALHLRGGLSEVRRRSGGHPKHWTISNWSCRRCKASSEPASGTWRPWNSVRTSRARNTRGVFRPTAYRTGPCGCWVFSLREGLFRAGELLTLNQLEPDPSALADPEGRQLKLFGAAECERALAE